MDGDVSPINKLYQLADKYNAWLLTDDAHGLGILPTKKSHIQMGTLSKAVGSYGGYVCASDNIIEYLRNKSRSLIYSTALPPAILASSIAAINIISKDKELANKALANARHFTRILNLPEAQSTIVPLVLQDTERTIKASQMLEEAGFMVSAIRPPTVPVGTARLRFTFSAMHNIQNIDKLAFVIKQNILYD
jgi:8-amino-7-oxononanoate synthase